MKTKILSEIKFNFNLSYEEAEVALLILEARARSMDISFESYIETYHPEGFSQKDELLSKDEKGYVQFLFDDTKALINAGKGADFSTFIHENAHVFRRQLTGSLKEKAEKAFNIEDSLWSEEQEEAFAIGFEEYIRFRLAATEEHKEVFAKGSLFMQKIYNGLDRIIELNPEIIKVYDELFTSPQFQFNSEKFNKNVDELYKLPDNKNKFSSSHIYLGMTPPIYQEIGFERLPIMVTSRHLKNIMTEEPEKKKRNINYHGLSPDLIKQIPEAIKKPLLIMQSATHQEDLVSVIELKDKKGASVVIPIAPYKKGFFNGGRIDINLTKSIYGKDKITLFIKNAFEQNRILYINKKSQVLSIPGLQLPDNKGSRLIYDNITQYKNYVNSKLPDNQKLYQKTAYYSNTQLAFDFGLDDEKPKKTETQNNIVNNAYIFKNENIKIINNIEMERVQISFSSIPSEEIRTDLKKHGWRWSPKNYCWQRKNTVNGLDDAIRIQNKYFEKKLNEKQTLEKTSSYDQLLHKSLDVLNFNGSIVANQFIVEVDNKKKQVSVYAEKNPDGYKEFKLPFSYIDRVGTVDGDGLKLKITTHTEKTIKSKLRSYELDKKYGRLYNTNNRENDNINLLKKENANEEINQRNKNGQRNSNSRVRDGQRGYYENGNFGLESSSTDTSRTNNGGQNFKESTRKIHTDSSIHDFGRSRQMGNKYVQEYEKGDKRGEHTLGISKSTNGSLEDNLKPATIKEIRKQCIEILNSKTNAEMSEEDKKILSKYEGAGGVNEKNRSVEGVLYEFYTPKKIISKVWELVDSYAPTAKTVLEPSGGIGRFIENRENNENTLIEIDETSARIAKILHPTAKVRNEAFQAQFFENGVVHKKEYVGEKYDLVIGNPPYGSYSGFYKGRGEGKEHSRYEEYFIERSLDTLKDGGLLAFVVPSSFLQSQENKAKNIIAEKGKLIDAWRLPNGVFNTTDVGTDIIILQKAKGELQDYCNNSYFQKNKNKVLGFEKTRMGRFGEEKYIAFNNQETIEDVLSKIKPIDFKTQILETKSINNNTPSINQIKEKLKSKTSEKIVKTYSKTLTADEFSKKYGQNIDKREVPIWKNTDYEGIIYSYKLDDDSQKYLEENSNYVRIDGGKWMHKMNYCKGNIYEKLKELEKHKTYYDKEIYENCKKLLEDSLPEKIPFEKINIPALSTLAQEFEIKSSLTGENISLQEAFLNWGCGNEAYGENSSVRFLHDDFSPLLKDDFPKGVKWNDVYEYINGIPVRAETSYDDEQKKANQIEAQKLRHERKATAEKLFNRYIQEALPEEYKKELELIYNERFNGYNSPDYSKLPLFIEGMSSKKNGVDFTLYEQQLKGISFLTNKGNGLLAYDVGVGKTACGIVATVNQIQANRAERPVICVPKSVYSKWLEDIKELFPNIKVNDLENFSESKLSKFTDGDHGLKIENGSISLITNEALQKITFKEDTIDNELAADLLDVRLNIGGNARENAKEKEKVKEILGVATSANDNYIFWENTGFDHITVDEAHRFKNLFTMPKPQYDNNSKMANEFDGITSGVPSKRAQKLFAITQLIQRKNNNRNVFLLTATPFTNSPTEIYSMLSYMARKKLQDMHLYNLNAFMTEFAETKTDWVVKASGDIVSKQVMKQFKHLKPLQNFITEFIDKVDAKEAGVIRPERFSHPVKLNMNEVQKQIVEHEVNRIANLTKDDPGGALVAMNNMRMAMLSPALVNNPDYKFELPSISELVESSPKLTFICDSVAKSYKDMPSGGQVIYMPRGVEYFDEVKKYLVKKGVPSEAIALINSSTSNSKKDKITHEFNDKNSKLKIIIGSETISEGIDLNGNSFALYNAMLGWNPTESVQVEGRIWRQGNEQGHVHIVYPLINDSIDSLMYQKHDEKASRINALWSYKGDTLNVEEINPEELKFDLIKDPVKKANFFIAQEEASINRELLVVEQKIKDIDELVERKIETKKTLQYCYENLSNEYCDTKTIKKRIKDNERKLKAISKKEIKLGIETEGKLKLKFNELNSLKTENAKKIEDVRNKKDEYIKKFKEINEAKSKNFENGSLDSIVNENVSKIMNNLKDMKTLKMEKEVEKKMDKLNMVKTSDLIMKTLANPRVQKNRIYEMER